MKVVILCGGYGMRIRDVSAEIPKPMVPVGRQPILWHIMKIYSHFGVRDFVLCLGYKGHVIKDFFLNLQTSIRDVTIRPGKGIELYNDGPREEEDWSITLAETGIDTMTGGRVGRIRKYVEDDANFLLTYGDGVSDVDINRLIEFHNSHGRAMTITGVRPPGRFGELTIAENDKVVGFNEKPQVSGGYISGGFFVCSQRVFDFVSEDAGLVFEEAPMRALAEADELRVFRHDDFWQPMDTFRDFRFLNDLWDRGEAPWRHW